MRRAAQPRDATERRSDYVTNHAASADSPERKLPHHRGVGEGREGCTPELQQTSDPFWLLIFGDRTDRVTSAGRSVVDQIDPIFREINSRDSLSAIARPCDRDARSLFLRRTHPAIRTTRGKSGTDRGRPDPPNRRESGDCEIFIRPASNGGMSPLTAPWEFAPASVANNSNRRGTPLQIRL